MHAPAAFLNEVVDEVNSDFDLSTFQILINFFDILQGHDPLEGRRPTRIIDRLDEYRAKGLKQKLSPDRVDMFADG